MKDLQKIELKFQSHVKLLRDILFSSNNEKSYFNVILFGIEFLI
jgi:hypothetical protein